LGSASLHQGRGGLDDYGGGLGAGVAATSRCEALSHWLVWGGRRGRVNGCGRSGFDSDPYANSTSARARRRMTQRTTRAERMAQPRAADAVRMLAEASGGCIRPVLLRRTDLDTGQAGQVIVPCGSTVESACPACTELSKSLRAQPLSTSTPLGTATRPSRWRLATWPASLAWPRLPAQKSRGRRRDRDAVWHVCGTTRVCGLI
jgi:hypothetical protein